MIELSIVIVSWNVQTFLRRCLLSIENQQDDLSIEVIVVDSASTDSSVKMVNEEFPQIQLIECNQNVGFPKGNNIGMKEARGHFILLLNPDTELIDGALKSLTTYLDKNEDVGVAGGQLLNSDGTIQSSRRRFPTLATALFESTWLQPFAPRSLLRRYYVEDLPYDTTTEVDWLTGACLMTHREVVEEVGFMDEAYFMYSEELDWCKRIKDAGWKVVYVPDARIVHHTGKSSDQAITERHINFQRAKLRYFRKYHGIIASSIIRSALLLNYLWQLIIEVGKGILGSKRQLRWQRARSYIRVLRSGLKPAGY
jgi:GT2 family glycosyltransferase